MYYLITMLQYPQVRPHTHTRTLAATHGYIGRDEVLADNNSLLILRKEGGRAVRGVVAFTRPPGRLSQSHAQVRGKAVERKRELVRFPGLARHE